MPLVTICINLCVMVKTFQEAIDLWPTPAPSTLAADVGASVHRVRKWRARNSVPGEWWQPMIECARRRGILLSIDDLARIAAKDRKKGRAA